MSENGKPHKNGWKRGDDPTVRALRALAALVFVITIPMMVLLDRLDAGFASAIILGVLVLLGLVEGAVRLPEWLKGPKDDGPSE